MWTMFKVFIEFVTVLFLFYVLIFWTWAMWDLSSPTRDGTFASCSGRRSLNHWTARAVSFDYSCHSLLCTTSFSWALGLSWSFQLHRDPSSKLCSWDFLILFCSSILRQFSFHPLHCPDPLYFDLTPSSFSLVWVVVLQSSEAHKLFQFL